MHIIDFCFVDYFFEQTWVCKEGFNMCYLCRSDLGYNGQDPRGLGLNPSLSLSFEAKFLDNCLLLEESFAHVQIVCKLLLLALGCCKDHHILHTSIEMLAIAHT
jgi:hypothetical protein